LVPQHFAQAVGSLQQEPSHPAEAEPDLVAHPLARNTLVAKIVANNRMDFMVFALIRIGIYRGAYHAFGKMANGRSRNRFYGDLHSQDR
jgi:hypothetical protein